MGIFYDPNDSQQRRESLLDIFTRLLVEDRDNKDLLISHLLQLSIDSFTAEELASIAEFIIGFYYPRRSIELFDTFDLCGTGGDKKWTANISTISAVALAECADVRVAKMCGGSSTSHFGSVESLENFGFRLVSCPGDAYMCMAKSKLAFLGARSLYPIFDRVAEARKLHGQPSLFNLLGPLVNPLFPVYRLLGTYSESLASVMAATLQRLGVKRAKVVCSCGGYDEATTTHDFISFTVGSSRSHRRCHSPLDFGFPLGDANDLKLNIEMGPRETVLSAIRSEKSLWHTIQLNVALALQVVQNDLSDAEAGDLARKLVEAEKMEHILGG